jgi:hypothetical protein
MIEVIDCVVAFCKHLAFSKPKSVEIIYIYIYIYAITLLMTLTTVFRVHHIRINLLV